MRWFDARFLCPSERSSKSTDFPRRISAVNQCLKNPYCLGEVRSFGEKGRRESDFGRSERFRGQQLFAQNRAFPGVFRRRGQRRRPYGANDLADQKELGSNLRCVCVRILTIATSRSSSGASAPVGGGAHLLLAGFLATIGGYREPPDFGYERHDFEREEPCFGCDEGCLECSEKAARAFRELAGPSGAKILCGRQTQHSASDRREKPE